MKRKTITSLCIVIFFAMMTFGCNSSGCQEGINIIYEYVKKYGERINLRPLYEKKVEKCEKGINLLPMYGNVEKCKEQLEADERFLAMSDKKEPNRTQAAIKIIGNGWFYLRQGDYDTAMRRVNQAWLLDNTNVVVYVSFTAILDLSQKTDEAIKMLDLTFDKINARPDPEEPTRINPSNQTLIDFVVANASFAYKKKENPILAQRLYEKLDELDMPELNRESLKNKLITDIPELSN